jgi:hypothetical protein
MEYKVPLSAVKSESFARMYKELATCHSKRLLSERDDFDEDVEVPKPSKHRTKHRTHYNKKDVDLINNALREKGIFL